jgi:activator of 2-hydroxyglutaryl-CoA dehydratase
MTDETTRPTRADEVRQERRRKPGETTHYGVKLHVPEDKKDPRYTYRHVNDTGDRIEAMKAEDWDPAPIDGKSVTSRHVGTDAGGKSIKAVLMRKQKAWYEADQKEKRKPLDEMEEAIKRGTAHTSSNEPELAGAVAYTPGGGNTIGR